MEIKELFVSIDLHLVLKKEFPDANITTLGDITKKIAVISKVRVGDTKLRTFTDYDEISLNCIDKYGVIYIESINKEMEPASLKAIHNQRLEYTDLIVTHRGKLGRCGLVAKNYNRIIVGNNSMIRIQFHDKTKLELSLFVQAYLLLPYVKQYMDQQLSVSKDRKILTSAWLKTLPIPVYKTKYDKDILYYAYPELTRLIQTKLDIVARSAALEQDIKNLIDLSIKKKNDSLKVIINTPDTIKNKILKNEQLVDELIALQNKIKQLTLEF